MRLLRCYENTKVVRSLHKIWIYWRTEVAYSSSSNSPNSPNWVFFLVILYLWILSLNWMEFVGILNFLLAVRQMIRKWFAQYNFVTVYLERKCRVQWVNVKIVHTFIYQLLSTCLYMYINDENSWQNKLHNFDIDSL